MHPRVQALGGGDQLFTRRRSWRSRRVALAHQVVVRTYREGDVVVGLRSEDAAEPLRAGDARHREGFRAKVWALRFIFGVRDRRVRRAKLDRGRKRFAIFDRSDQGLADAAHEAKRFQPAPFLFLLEWRVFAHPALGAGYDRRLSLGPEAAKIACDEQPV